ncbi:hypothetical protein [Streptomyces sp. KE1]|uniref:hypothetical protein n=1 Tax=Streptomyces sp. KE1 TaxID=1638939 RepID=UPI000AE6D473|nr:hypothetical protein [Streptomyces sp. KE1]
MTFKRGISAGMVALVSCSVLASGGVPVNAAAGGRLVAVKAAGKCGNWKRAGSLPGKWSVAKDTCSIFGHAGYTVSYAWAAEKGSLCVKVKGLKGGKMKWFDAGCGKKGQITKVPWGNAADYKAIKVKGAALLRWR